MLKYQFIHFIQGEYENYPSFCDIFLTVINEHAGKIIIL